PETFSLEAHSAQKHFAETAFSPELSCINIFKLYRILHCELESSPRFQLPPAGCGCLIARRV
ncbi:MAG TPA: hypothetical protein VGF13_17850, partial [Verrucomicrobiae bacterium]